MTKTKHPVVRLTPEQAVKIVRNWPFPIMSNDELIGDFLLLISAITDETDANKRWEISMAFQRWLAPYANATERAIEELIKDRIRVVQQ